MISVGDMISGKRSSDGRYVTGTVTEINSGVLTVDGIDVVTTTRATYQVRAQDVLTSMTGAARRG